MEKFTEINEEYVEEILKLSKEMFEGNLYVKCVGQHPCGWDKIEIEYLDDVYNDTLFLSNISNNIYCEHPFEDKSLFYIISTVGMKGWSFVPPTICPDDFSSIGI